MARDNAEILLFRCLASKRLRQYLWLLHALVLVALLLNGLPQIIKVILSLLVLVHLWFALRSAHKTQATIRYTESLGWEFLVDNVFKPIDVLKSTVITTQVLFLHFNYNLEPKGLIWPRKNVFVVVSDMLSEQDYRHLVVKLRMTVIK